MYLILFVLDNTDLLNDVLNAWEEVGVCGITILPSTGLGRIRKNCGLRDDFPIFPALQDLLEHEENLNQTLLSVIDDDSLVEQAVRATQRVVGNLDDPNTGILVVLPIARIYGVAKVGRTNRQDKMDRTDQTLSDESSGS
jgi:nitrogen regulatory protein P-II 1